MRRALALLLLLAPKVARASIVDGTADEVFGQPSMMSAAAPTAIDASTVSSPAGLVLAKSAGLPVLLIAEPARHRVLGIKGLPPFAPATLVFGQASLTVGSANRGETAADNTLSGVTAGAFEESFGRLALADTNNHRVLVGSMTGFDQALGQSSLTTAIPNAGGISAGTLNGPRAVAFVDRLVYVADTDNHRVLLFNLAGDPRVATNCYGQITCNHGEANRGASTPATDTFKNPSGIASDPLFNRVYVADTGNHRVVERVGTSVVAMYGQLGSFNTGTPSKGGVSASSMNTPVAVAWDRRDGFWVVDQLHYRVLHYPRGAAAADRVLGQKTVTDAIAGSAASASTFVLPTGVAVAANGDVYVADGGAHRVLRFAFTCEAGACSDGNPCTDDSCVPGTGCVFSAPRTYPTACLPYACDVANKVCRNDCATVGCAGGFRCTANKRCVRTCSATSPCAKGFCVNGACCDSLCTGRCESCELVGREGVCAPYIGKPKTPCSAALAECAGQCDGSRRDDCAPLPAGSSCGAESCSGGVETRRGRCDAAGVCSSEQRACAPFACGGGVCNASCRFDFDCAEGARCDGERCVANLRVSGEGCAHAGAVEGASVPFLVWAVSALAAMIRRRQRS